MNTTEYNRGAASARDSIIATLIGMQNKNSKPNSEEYKLLQKALNTITDRHGDMFKPYRG